MALILRHWRTWLALAVLGSAGAFGYRGDWAWAAGAAALVLLRVACRFWCEMLATREVLRAFAETEALCATYSRAATTVRGRRSGTSGGEPGIAIRAPL